MLYIATLEEIKQELQIDDAAEDANLTLWAEGMQARFDNRCGRRLLSGEEVEILDGGMDKIYLNRFPVESVESVHLSIVGAFDESSLLDPASDYRLIAARGELLHGLMGADAWPEGHGNVRVAYTGGFYACDADSVPTGFAMPLDLRLAFLMQFTSLWKNRGNLGIQTVQSNGSSVSYGNSPAIVLSRMTLLPDVEIILDKYQRWA